MVNIPEDINEATFLKTFNDKPVVFNNQISTGLLLLTPGFHHTENSTTTTQKLSDYGYVHTVPERFLICFKSCSGTV